jgi:hypothetical protein
LHNQSHQLKSNIVTEIYMLYFSAIKGGYEKAETIGGLPFIPAVYSGSHLGDR